MKNFLKTMGLGIAVIFTAFTSVVMIATVCIDFFVELPTKTGIVAVGLFVYALIKLLIGGGLIYILGDMLKNYNG